MGSNTHAWNETTNKKVHGLPLSSRVKSVGHELAIGCLACLTVEGKGQCLVRILENDDWMGGCHKTIVTSAS